MAQPYIGEIRQFAGNFAPSGWMLCQGQLLPISEYETLFVLIGTTYGGDGQSTFGLPDLQGRVPIHMGNNGGNSYVLGQSSGTESVTLTAQQMPAHSHIPSASSVAGTLDNPANNFWAASSTGKPYTPAPGNLNMNAAAVTPAGGSQPHDNMIPYLAINYIISLFGIFPTQ